MVEDIKYKVSKDLINKISTTVDANPKITDEELFKTFPDLNNDAKFLKAIGEYKATKEQYKDEKIVDSKFPEFDFVTVQGPTNEGSAPDTAYTVSIPEGATVSAEKEDPIAKDNIARNNWLTYIADQALAGGVKGIANTAAAAQDFKEFIAGKMIGAPVIEAGGMMIPIDEKAKTAIKRGQAEDIENLAGTVGGISTKAYKEEKRKGTEENLFTWDVIPVGVGMVADVIGQNALTGGAGMYTTMFESAKNDALAKGLDENQAFAYGSTIGLAVGAISHYGINKMLKGLPKSAQDKVTRYIADKALDNLSKAGRSISPEMIQKEISSVAQSYAGKVASMGTKAAYNAATQGTAMVGIEGTMYGTEQATNKILNKEIFKTPDVKMRFAKALVNGAVGGLAVGGVTGAFTKGATDNYINKKIQETIKDDEQYNEFRTQLANDLTKNDFNTPGIEEILNGIDLKREKLKKIPNSITPAAQLETLDIIDTRDQLKQELDALNPENVDPAFRSDIEAKRVIVEEKIKAVEDSAKAVNDGTKIVYRATEKGFEKDVNGQVEPITEEQFDYANESKLKGIKVENKELFTYYERDGKYFKKFGKEGKEQAITKTTYDFELGRQKRDKPTAEKVEFFHGGNLDSEGDIFLSPDKTIAKEYASINGGKVSSFEVNKSKIIGEQDVRAIIEDLGLENKEGETQFDELMLHELLDPRFETSFSESDIAKIKEAVKEKGFDAISFTDEDITQRNKGGVESILVLNKESLTTKPTEDATKIGTEPIEPQGGEQSSQQQYPRAEEGQPQVGEPEGSAGETPQPEANRGDSNIGSEARKQEINAKFVEAQKLYSDIIDAEGAAKKRSINKERQKMLDENPSIKFVLENMKALEEALGDRLKKSGDCP